MTKIKRNESEGQAPQKVQGILDPTGNAGLFSYA